MPTPADRRIADQGGAALTLGSIVAGLFAYLFIAVGTREYGAASFAGVAQLWTIWFFSASVLTFPIQHWVIQRLRTDGHGGAVRAAIGRLAAVALGLAGAVTLISYAVRSDLFGQSGLVYPLAAGAITAGAAAIGLLRGGLAGRSRFVAAACALGSENLLRLLAGLVVIAVGGGISLYAASIVAGLLVVLGWPGALRFSGPAPTGASPFAFLGNVAAGTVIAQSVLTGGPVVLSLTGGTDAEVTSLFTALAVFRIPFVIALGLGIRVTAGLSDLYAAGRLDALARIRHRIALGGVGLVIAGGLGAAALGPAVLRLVFGDEIDISGLECAGLAAGSTAALVTLGLTLVHMTHQDGRLIFVAWFAALAVGAVTMVVLPVDPLPRVVLAFLASELTAYALMARPELNAGRSAAPR